MSKQSQLAEALRSRTLVRFTRPFEEGTVNGYVVDIGPRFFILALVDGGIRFDGFQCFRISDVRQFQASGPHADFVEKVLKLRGQQRPRKPRVSMATLEDLLKSANRAFPLVTICREQADPDVCHIGRVEEVANGRLMLRAIDPSAAWDAEPQEYRLSEITQVDFGGAYEDALHLAGGPAPA